MKDTIGASIICMNPLELKKDISILDQCGVDYYHVDVMDGHFVPRYGIYPEICGHIALYSDTPLDVHLMVDEPEFAIDVFGKFENVEYIMFHYEAAGPDVFRIIDKIKDYGKKAGIVLNLSTPFSVVERVLFKDELDGIMFMGIHPGVLNQKKRNNIWSEVSDFKSKYGLPPFVQVDGQVTFDNIYSLKMSGVNNFICGSSTLFDNVPFGVRRREAIVSNFRKIKRMIKGENPYV